MEPQNQLTNIYEQNFRTLQYLKDFYSSFDNEVAMKFVLSLLPNVAGRLAEEFRKSRSIDQQPISLLDIGTGPSICVPVCFRQAVDEIYLSDFLESNRQFLKNWLLSPPEESDQKNNRTDQQQQFDWTSMLKFVGSRESVSGCDENQLSEMQRLAKQKTRSVYSCDITVDKDRPVISDRCYQQQFDVVTSFFCLEFAVRNSEDYRRALQNLLALAKPGGRVIFGGVFDVDWWMTGRIRFPCYQLSEEEVISLLRESGIEVDDEKSFAYWNYEGCYVMSVRKSNRV